MTDTPTPLTDERVAKLPRWAQDHVRHCERAAVEARAAAEEAKGADERPPIAVRDPYGEAFPVAFDQYDDIRFALHGVYDSERHGSLSDWVAIRRREEGWIEVMAAQAIELRVQSSNVVHVRSVR